MAVVAALSSNRTVPVSVIVVAYNAGPALADLVATLLPCCAQVIVVDNASQDGCTEGLVDGPGTLVVLRNEQNRGFAVAVNQALDRVTQNWTLVLNPDCRVECEVLQRLAQRMTESPCAAAGVRVMNEDGSEQRASRRNLPRFGTLVREVLGLPGGVNLTGRPGTTENVEAVSGAFVWLRTEVFRALGGMDAGYFLHCEDLDLFARLKAAGHCVEWHGDLSVVHGKGQAGCDRKTVERHKHEGMLRYFDRHMAAEWPRGLKGAARWFIRLHGLWTRTKLRMGWSGVRR